MTITVSEFVVPDASVTEIAHVPAATDVTVNVPLGPLAEGEKVAIPEHDELIAANEPVYPVSVAENGDDAPTVVKRSGFGAIAMDAGVCVGAAVGGDVGAVVGDDVGATVGDDVGTVVGTAVGDDVGATVGDDVGGTVGAAVGAAVGTAVAASVGAPVGAEVVAGVDGAVGAAVGVEVVAGVVETVLGTADGDAVASKVGASALPEPAQPASAAAAARDANMRHEMVIRMINRPAFRCVLD